MKNKSLSLLLLPLILFSMIGCAKQENCFKVEWKNFDGSILEIDEDVQAGSIPSYDGNTPSKPEDDNYEYTFSGWSPEIKPIFSDTTFTANYTSKLVNSFISFNLNGGTTSENYQGKYVACIESKDFFFDLEKDGFNFRGWSYNGDKVFDQHGNKLFDPKLSEYMEFIAIFSETAEMEIKKNIENAGSVNGEGEYPYNTYVNLTATPFAGYEFVGWYYQEFLLSNQTQYKYKIENKDVVLEARFRLSSYLLEVESYDTNLGLIMLEDCTKEYTGKASKYFDFNTKISISAYTKTVENEFLGWFDVQGKLISTAPVYIFNMPSTNYKLFAKWDLFSLDLTSNNSNAGTISNSDKYKSGTEVTFKALPNKGYSFIGWYDRNGNLKFQSSVVTIEMPTENLFYEAKFSLNNYSVVVSSEDINKGSVTGDGTYSFGSNVILKAFPNDGYDFKGWYDGETRISSNSTYTFSMPAHDVSYVAKFYTNYYTVLVASENSMQGTVSGSGTYLYNSEVTIQAIPREGCTFLGWYKDSLLVSTESVHTFYMPCSNIKYTAKFAGKEYKVIVSSEDIELGTVTGNGMYACGTNVTIEAHPNKANPYSFVNFLFEGWYDGETKVSSNSTYTFSMPAHDVNYVAKFNIMEKEIGDKVLFGYYPQTMVTDEATISELKNKAGGLPTSGNNNWILYDWYVSPMSSAKDFAWFIDLDVNGDGCNDYRGVYFTAYRHSSQKDNGYKIKTVYFFEYEPIEWRLLQSNNESFFLMSNAILDSNEYSRTYNDLERFATDYNGDSSYAYINNYKYSEVRSFLNTTFFNTAFNETQKNRIQTANVDNSVESTGYSTNSYICENTNDKIFLLSYKDIINTSYGFSNDLVYNDSRKQLVATDYAACMGCHIYKNFYSCWWTRSPYSGDATAARYVSEQGWSTSTDCYAVSQGIVPALFLLRE